MLNEDTTKEVLKVSCLTEVLNKRSRVSVVRDKHFSVTNNDEFIKFCKSTGARRTAIGRL